MPKTVIAMSRKLVISSVLLPGESMPEGQHQIGRDNLMGRLHAMLQYDPVSSPRGDIEIKNLSNEFFPRDERYWGGDGIELTIPSRFTTKDLFEGINQHCMDSPLFVVFDPETGDMLGKPEPALAAVRPVQDKSNVVAFERRPK